MPAKRVYAVVEWDFLRFDPRYRSLPDDLGRAYIHFWATCVMFRQEKFSPEELVDGRLADRVGVTTEVIGRLVAECLRNGLMSRGPGGIIKLDGVRTKHSQLRGWSADKMRRRSAPEVRPKCAPDRDRDRDRDLELDLERSDKPEKHEDSPAAPEAGPARHAPAARDKPSDQLPKPYEAEALHLVDLYGELVKPPSLDTSRAQAKLNILGRLKKGGYDFATLERCIRRYAEHCAILGQEAQFRKNAGNFFGRERVFETFAAADWQPPKPPEAKAVRGEKKKIPMVENAAAGLPPIERLTRLYSTECRLCAAVIQPAGEGAGACGALGRENVDFPRPLAECPRLTARDFAEEPPKGEG